MPQEGAKKLASVSTTSTSVTEDSKKAILVSVKKLEQVTCIQYLIAFPGSVTQDGLALDLVLALFNSGSEVNAIYSAFAERVGLVVKVTNVGAQKIDGTILETYGMVVAAFSVTDQANRVRFFEKTFLIANVSPDIVFGMLFLTLSSADVNFQKRGL